LEDSRGEDDRVSRRMWEVVGDKAGKVRIAETEGGRKKKKKKTKRGGIVEIKRVVEEWKIWDKEKEAAKSEAKAKKLVLERFHK